MARKARQGGTIVSVHRGFHGRTYGSLSATPQESKQAPFAPLVPGFVAVEPTAAALRAAIDERTAAVILEPIQGESGVWELGGDVLRAAREACDAAGAALIFDEVQTGLGRTGRLWAYEHWGVVPDLMTVAKALGGGLPIGAVVTNERFAAGFEAGDHGSTFAGGPVACSAALAVMDVIDDEALLARVRDVGDRLRATFEEHPAVAAIRGRGGMLALELHPDRDETAPALVSRALADEQLVLNATGPTTLRLLPPLTITDIELDDAVERLTRLLD
jgi:acetylornithine/N-succinyldiaminopimelate aminotransferase